MLVVKVTVTRDPCVPGDEDTMMVEVTKTDMRTNRVYIFVYKTICYLLFRVGGPLATLIVLNSRLLTTLRHQKRWRRSQQTLMTSRVSAWHRENVTAMLVTVVTVFIICELPDSALRLVYAAVQLNSDPSDELLLALRYVNTITNALLAFNSSINFIIYFLVGRTFRRVFIGSLVCRPRHQAVAMPTAADDDASFVTMTTLRRRHLAVAKETETRTLLAVPGGNQVDVNISSNSAVIPSGNSMTSQDYTNNHVTIVSVDVER